MVLSFFRIVSNTYIVSVTVHSTHSTVTTFTTRLNMKTRIHRKHYTGEKIYVYIQKLSFVFFLDFQEMNVYDVNDKHIFSQEK